MIRVNLSGSQKKAAAAKAVAAPATGPSNALPLIHLVILLATAAGGYFWYSSLTAQSTALTNRIGALQEEQKKLDEIIKQDRIYEARKIALENRIRVIEDLKKNQLSPVVVLDALDEAIDRTRLCVAFQSEPEQRHDQHGWNWNLRGYPQRLRCES